MTQRPRVGFVFAGRCLVNDAADAGHSDTVALAPFFQRAVIVAQRRFFVLDREVATQASHLGAGRFGQTGDAILLLLLLLLVLLLLLLLL